MKMWPRLLLTVLLMFVAGSASGQTEAPVFDRSMVIFVWPDSNEVVDLKDRMGEDNFYVAADDENWYRSIAFGLLDSLGIEFTAVAERKLSFLVDGRVREYDWTHHKSPWFVVLYDGIREPRVTYSVNIPSEIDFLAE